MQFLTMQQELADRLSAFDETVSTDATKLKRWLNMAQQDVSGAWDWQFLRTHAIVTTVPDITTGTIATAASSTTVTFSSAPASSVTGYFLQTASSNDWYEVTAHAAASTSATISPAAIQGDAGITYTLRKLFYTPSTSLQTIYSIKQSITPGNLESLRVSQFEYYLPLRSAASTPYTYALAEPSSTGAVRFSLYPTPSDAINLYVSGKLLVTDLSADTDSSLVPAAYHRVILDRAAYYGFLKLDDSRAQVSYQASELGIEEMKRIFSYDKGQSRVMKAIDDTPPNVAYALPSNFGEMTSG